MQLALTNIFIQLARYFGICIWMDLVLDSTFLSVTSSCKIQLPPSCSRTMMEAQHCNEQATETSA